MKIHAKYEMRSWKLEVGIKNTTRKYSTIKISTPFHTLHRVGFKPYPMEGKENERHDVYINLKPPIACVVINLQIKIER